jgi:ABC-type glycerol-3-phosphate transport system substrate-binding protein
MKHLWKALWAGLGACVFLAACTAGAAGAQQTEQEPMAVEQQAEAGTVTSLSQTP